MLSGHRSAWRRRGNKSRAARIAIPLAIPVALGLTLGIIIAVSGGNTTKIAQSAMGSCASAAASAAARRSGSKRHQPRAPVPRPLRPAPQRQRRGRGRALPVGIRLSGSSGRGRRGCHRGQLRHPAEQRGEPGRPGRGERGGRGRQRVQLQPERGSGRGLDELHRIRAGQPAHRCGPGLTLGPRRRLHLGQRRDRGRVRGGHDPVAAGQLQVYDPLVINQGTTPAVAPTPPTIAAGSQVIISARVQRQRAGPGGPGRGAGQLHRRVRQLDHQPDPAVQRGQLLPDGQRRDRPRHADDPGDRHRQGRPGLPDHA